MERADHTAGPWVVKTHKKNRICGPEGIIVGEAWYPPAKAKRNAKQMARDIGEANARVMAAGPEILAALEAYEAATVYLEQADIATDPERVREIADQLWFQAEELSRAAIAKARGV